MKRTAYLLDSYFYLNIIQIFLKLWFSIKSEDFDILLLTINFIFEFSVHTFLMFCFLSCSVSGMGKRQTLKKNLLYR